MQVDVTCACALWWRARCALKVQVAHAYVKLVRQAVSRGVRCARSGRVDVRVMYGFSLGLYVALLTQDSRISASPWWWSSLTQAGGKSRCLLGRACNISWCQRLRCCLDNRCG